MAGVLQGIIRLFSFDRLTKAVGALLARAVAAGAIRADISPEDLLRALIGMCYLHEQPGWQSTVLRLMDVFIDWIARTAGCGQSQRDAVDETQCCHQESEDETIGSVIVIASPPKLAGEGGSNAALQPRQTPR